MLIAPALRVRRSGARAAQESRDNATTVIADQRRGWEEQGGETLPEGICPIPDRVIDPEPLSAFHLGFYSRHYRVQQRLLWWGLDSREEVMNRMERSLELVEKSLVILASEVSSYVGFRLHMALEELEDFIELLREKVNSLKPDDGPWGLGLSEEAQSWSRKTVHEYFELCDLADQALRPGSPLGPFAKLGAAFGELMLSVVDWGGEGAPPSQREFVLALQALPHKLPPGIPDLSLLATATPEDADRIQGAVVQKWADAGENTQRNLLRDLTLIFNNVVEYLMRYPRICATPTAIPPVVPTDLSQELPSPTPHTDRSLLSFDLSFHNDQHQVERPGFQAVAFEGAVLFWELFKVLASRPVQRWTNVKLKSRVWEPFGRTEDPEGSTIQGAISKLRKKILPLGLDINFLKGIGYQLQVLSNSTP